MWRMMKKMTECARSAVMLDGEISRDFVDIFTRSRTGMYVITQFIEGILLMI